MAISQTISILAKSALVVLVGLSFMTLTTAAQPQDPATKPPPRAKPVQRKRPGVTLQSRERIRQAVAAVGLILVRTSPDSGQPAKPRGSAVVIRKDGLIATNYHVIFDSRSGRLFGELLLSLSPDGSASSTSVRYRLKPVLINKEYDLALLKIEPETTAKAGTPASLFRPVVIGDSRSVRLLDDLFIIGFPEKGGLDVTVNRGSIEGKDILGNWIKTDGRMIHGNSGGAAVNSRGELIGIPTKVIADSQPIDRDGDGFPEDVRVFGAVGFVRPAHLVSAMLAELDSQGIRTIQAEAAPAVMAPSLAVTIRGVAKSAVDGKPIAGALVGLLPKGITEVSENTLLTWGSANGDGQFVLNKPVPPGLYTLRARALAYEVSTREIVIDDKGSPLVIELQPTTR